MEKNADLNAEAWRSLLLTRFPRWGSSCDPTLWQSVIGDLRMGQAVEGVVVCQAPFGVWLDIGKEWPALLMVVDMVHSDSRQLTIADFPLPGEHIKGRIAALGDVGEIRVVPHDI